MISKHVDGKVFAIQAVNNSTLDGRHSLGPTAILFADEDAESQVAYINSIQIRNYRMQDAEIAELGGPDARGIPSKVEALSRPQP